MIPADHLITYSRLYPGAWRVADELRRDRGWAGLPDWPAWCFLPLGGWHAYLGQGHGPLLPPEMLGELPLLAALGAWRYTQGIYQVQPDLLHALVCTELSGELPTEVLFRLPEWCVYVETPGLRYSELGLAGYFAFLEHDANTGHAELRLVLDLPVGLLGTVPLHIGPWSLGEALDRAVQTADAYAHLLSDGATVLEGVRRNSTALLRDMAPLVSILLYLCSDEPDLAGQAPGERPRHPRPKKTKQGWRLFPPERPRLWRVGAAIGARLYDGAPPPSDLSGPVDLIGPERKGPRPHIRRAHWHGYWSGSRDETPERPRRYRYRWLPPIVVGVGND